MTFNPVLQYALQVVVQNEMQVFSKSFQRKGKNLFLQYLCFQMFSVKGRNLFLQYLCFQMFSVKGKNLFPQYLCFQKFSAKGKNLFPQYLCFQMFSEKAKNPFLQYLCFQKFSLSAQLSFMTFTSATHRVLLETQLTFILHLTESHSKLNDIHLAHNRLSSFIQRHSYSFHIIHVQLKESESVIQWMILVIQWMQLCNSGEWYS